MKLSEIKKTCKEIRREIDSISNDKSLMEAQESLQDVCKKQQDIIEYLLKQVDVLDAGQAQIVTGM